MKLCYYILLLLLVPTNMVAQVICVDVVDEQKQPLAFAAVVAINQADSSIVFSGVTNVKGKMIFDNQQQFSLIIQVSYLGYHTISSIVFPSQKELRIALKQKTDLLDEVVITGQIGAEMAKNSAYPIQVISAKEISKQGAQNVADILKVQNNIQINYDPLLGTGIRMQGLSGKYVQVLIDGVPLMGRLNGEIDLSQISVASIERIEVVNTPLSVSYGTNAIAGTINIITKKEIKHAVNAYYESVGQYNVGFNTGLKLKNKSLKISGGRNFFGGFDEFDSSRVKTWKPKVQYVTDFSFQHNFNKAVLKLLLNGVQETITNRGIPRSPYYETAFDEYYTTKRLTPQLSFNYYISPYRSFTLSASRNYYSRIKQTLFKNLVTLDEVNVMTQDAADTTKFIQDFIKGEYLLKDTSSAVAYQFGLEYRNEKGISERFSEVEVNMLNAAAFAQAEWIPNKQLKALIGLRYTYNNQFKSPVTPAMSVAFNFKKSKLQASYANGFRAPSLKEMYFEFVDINHQVFGNNKLIPEQSNSLTMKLTNDHTVKWSSFASTYHNIINNQIVLVNNSGTRYEYVNLQKQLTSGFSIGSTYQKELISFSFQGGLNLWQPEIIIGKKEELIHSPEARFQGEVLCLNKKLSIQAVIKYNGAFPFWQFDANNNVVLTKNHPYTLVNLNAKTEFFNHKMKVSTGIKNLTNVTSFLSSGNIDGGAHGSSANQLISWGRSYFLSVSYAI